MKNLIFTTEVVKLKYIYCNRIRSIITR